MQLQMFFFLVIRMNLNHIKSSSEAWNWVSFNFVILYELRGIIVYESHGILVYDLHGIIVYNLHGIIIYELHGIIVYILCGIIVSQTGDVCNLPRSAAGVDYAEYNLLFFRVCDENTG